MSALMTEEDCKTINLKRILADLKTGLAGLQMEQHLYNYKNDFLILKLREKIELMQIMIGNK
jgi:hypothetical protein